MSYVTDDRGAINTDGLRIAKKVDTLGYPERTMKYAITCYYKGQEMDIGYGEDQASRDSMFDKLMAALESRNGRR